MNKAQLGKWGGVARRIDDVILFDAAYESTFRIGDSAFDL